MADISENRRKTVISIIIALAFFAIIGKLFYIQVIDSSYKFSAANNVLRYVTQYPARGLILDRNGIPLVTNKTAYDILIVKKQVKPFDTLEFANLLGLTVEQVKQAFIDVTKQRGYSPRKAVVLLKQIPAERYARLQEILYKYQGFVIQPRTIRNYEKPIAAHVLGYVGEVDENKIKSDPYYQLGDYIGINGLERSYESVLRGKKGVKVFLVDVHNRIKGSYENGKYDSLAVPGKNITSTLDVKLQEYGEKLMKNKIGSIVAIEPKTGEVLAMISSPTYDPNLLVGRERAFNFRSLLNDTLKPIFNRSIMALYPPGSTFKVVNALIGLQGKVVAPYTKYECHGGYTIGRGVGCHHHPSPVNLIQSIQVSCNTYYCHVFRNIIDKKDFGSVEDGLNAWKKHVLSFGYGKKLGIDLPNELNGIVPSVSFYNKYFRRGGWSSLTIISLAIGQGELAVTPLQMANLVATIANKGFYKTPHVVKSIEGQSLDEKFTQNHYTTIDSSYFDYIIEGMDLAVNGEPGSGSTARIAALPDIRICGKTGTAQNPHGKDHSVFFAFAPKDDPKIAISVYLENAGYGATWAAPIASLMIEKYLKDTISRPWLEKYIMEANLLDRRAKAN
ncbi:MAG: penicillin-binding protein 2 [Tenuifilum sp.]|uniref:penicillin-binding protein 2 n=1 Tax=Tenuifilum sp. TaxID=2760880 RepID=UPI0024AA23AC|nr:penicillin-binding protein 2 [Tenuifilum sp.]MDI3526932.1 penicillin-binding protein 2 [Tenuifilum sp.]